MLRSLINYSPKWLTPTRMGKSKKTGQVTQAEAPQSPVTLCKDGTIRVAILAKPGAKVSCVTSVDVDGVGVQIAARPVDGEANAELVQFICSVLGLKKNEISLDRGSKSRQKVLILSSPAATVESILESLKKAATN